MTRIVSWAVAVVTWRGIGVPALVMSAAVALSGCAGNDTSPAPTPGTFPASTPASPRPTGSQTGEIVGNLVLAQYRGFWRALPRASRLPEDEANALMGRYLVHPALAKVEGTLAAQRAFHKQPYGESVPRPISVKTDGAMATVVDCQKSDAAGVLDVKTGKRLTVGPARNLTVVTLRVAEDGTWKIATIAYTSGSC